MDIKKFGLFFLLGIILVITFKFLIIIEVFFPAITAACVLAYLFNPVYLYFLKIIKKKSLSALLVIFIIIVLGLIPITIIVSALQDQIVNLFKEETIANFRATLQSFENFVNNQFNIQISGYFPKDPADFIPGIISTAQDAIAAFGPGMIYSITGFLFSTFVTFFIMFYLLKNSKNVLHTIKSYFPLTIKNCDILLREMGKDTKALILGQVLIAAMQGTFGAIGFFIFGISGAILWGFVMMIVSFLPFLGTVLVWFPAVVAL
ncbi:MAG: AI-2E family transporter, partial [Candidatus Latescibacteria bacterium]|nr:AI-2E family transporter [Candidatus Latescibacterota bacterium]